jgi:hypothetical protein
VGLYWVLVLSRWGCVILGFAEWLRMFRKESVWKFGFFEGFQLV